MSKSWYEASLFTSHGLFDRFQDDDQVISDRAVGRQCNVDGKTVRHSRMLMAKLIHDRVRALGNLLRGAVETSPSHGVTLSWAMFALCWDEVLKILSLPLGSGQRRSNWHICVSIADVDLIWKTTNIAQKSVASLLIILNNLISRFRQINTKYKYLINEWRSFHAVSQTIVKTLL